MAPFSTKKHKKTFENCIDWNINIRKNKFLYEKIIGSVWWNKKSNSAMLVMLCTGADLVKKNSCLVARIVFDAAGLHLLTFLILEPYV